MVSDQLWAVSARKGHSFHWPKRFTRPFLTSCADKDSPHVPRRRRRGNIGETHVALGTPFPRGEVISERRVSEGPFAETLLLLPLF